MFHTYPSKGTYDLIIDNVGDNPADIEIWRECCTYWLNIGWNPKNISGQIERFALEWAKASPRASGARLEAIDGLVYKVYPDGSRELTVATISD